jgi:uncharacterized protein
MIAKVYYFQLKNGASASQQAKAISRLYELTEANSIVEKKDFVAIKFHVGEGTNTTRIKPELIRTLVEKVKADGGLPFLAETSTLYKGERHNAVQHLMQAHRQGFGIDNIGAPFIMVDGLLGNTEIEVTIPGEVHPTVNIAREIKSSDTLFVVSHATGCISTGLAACIKNLGMGLASRKGKRRQHSAVLPVINSEECVNCQKCSKWCPSEAIIEQNGKAYIVSEKCVGCGECIATCRFDAVKYDFGADQGYLQKSMAEHAYGAIIDKPRKCLFINVLTDMTQHCDCILKCSGEKLIPDLGIIASVDPVAVDQATHDLTTEAYGRGLGELAFPEKNGLTQIEHAEKIGMGTRQYELIKVV